MLAAGGLVGLTVRGFSPDGQGLFDGPAPWAALVPVGLVLGNRTRVADRKSSG